MFKSIENISQLLAVLNTSSFTNPIETNEIQQSIKKMFSTPYHLLECIQGRISYKHFDFIMENTESTLLNQKKLTSFFIQSNIVPLPYKLIVCLNRFDLLSTRIIYIINQNIKQNTAFQSEEEKNLLINFFTNVISHYSDYSLLMEIVYSINHSILSTEEQTKLLLSLFSLYLKDEYLSQFKEVGLLHSLFERIKESVLPSIEKQNLINSLIVKSIDVFFNTWSTSHNQVFISVINLINQSFLSIEEKEKHLSHFIKIVIEKDQGFCINCFDFCNCVNAIDQSALSCTTKQTMLLALLEKISSRGFYSFLDTRDYMMTVNSIRTSSLSMADKTRFNHLLLTIVLDKISNKVIFSCFNLQLCSNLVEFLDLINLINMIIDNGQLSKKEQECKNNFIQRGIEEFYQNHQYQFCQAIDLISHKIKDEQDKQKLLAALFDKIKTTNNDMGELYAVINTINAAPISLEKKQGYLSDLIAVSEYYQEYISRIFLCSDDSLVLFKSLAIIEAISRSVLAINYKEIFLAHFIGPDNLFRRAHRKGYNDDYKRITSTIKQSALSSQDKQIKLLSSLNYCYVDTAFDIISDFKIEMQNKLPLYKKALKCSIYSHDRYHDYTAEEKKKYLKKFVNNYNSKYLDKKTKRALIEEIYPPSPSCFAFFLCSSKQNKEKNKSTHPPVGS